MTKQPLEIEVAAEGRDLVIRARGEIDMASAPRLLAEIQRGIKQATGVHVDLQEVPFIDSSGIAVLVQGLRAASRTGRPFVLRRPSAKVLAVLELTDLQGLFRIDPEPPART